MCRVVALLTSGLNLGVLLAYLASPKVIALSSWENLFYVYGGLGLAWLLLWIPLGADKKDAGVTMRGLPAASPSRVLLPRTKPAAAAVEGEEEERDGWAKVANKGVDYVVSVPWGEFVRSKELWAVTAAHMAHNYGLYVALAWLPSYFASEYHMDLSHSSALSVMPWVGAAIMTNVAGWLADGLINSETMDRTSVRKLFQSLALLIPAACMYSLAHGGHTPYEAQAIFTTSIAAGSLSSAGFGTATQDLAKKYVGMYVHTIT
jgi:ACS family sodium-dependent inorganic phosphate cotransporter